MGQIEDAIRTELIPFPSDSMSAADIERQIGELNREFQELFAMSRNDGGFMKYADDFKCITDNISSLKESKARLLEQQSRNSASNWRIQGALDILNPGSATITEWNESTIRQLIDTVKVLSEDRIRVYFRGGIEIEQMIEKER